MDFANRFKTLRKEKGYTQQQIADLCFLDKSTVCRWEKGDNYPNQQTQSKLADLLGVSIDYLMGRTDMRMISFPSEAVIDMPIIGSVRAGMGGNIVSDAKRRVARTRAFCRMGLVGGHFLATIAKFPLFLRGFCVDNNCIVLYHMNGCATHASGCCPDCVGAFMVSAQLFLA